MNVNPKNYDTNMNRPSFQNDNGVFLKQRHSLSYRDQRNGFDNKNVLLNQNKKMSVDSEKPIKLKSKLFTPSTRLKTNNYED